MSTSQYTYSQHVTYSWFIPFPAAVLIQRRYRAYRLKVGRLLAAKLREPFFFQIHILLRHLIVNHLSPNHRQGTDSWLNEFLTC